MLRIWFLLVSAILLAGISIAQEAKPSASKSTPKTSPRPLVAPLVVDVDQDEDQYMIELRVLEGKDFLPDELDSRNGTTIDSVATIWKLFRHSPERASAPRAAYVT